MAYHRYITLYKDYAPNVKGGVYAIFKDPSGWIKEMSANHRLCVVEEDSYRMNEGTAIVNVASYSQLADFFKVSYIMEVFVNESPYVVVRKCYHVTSSKWQSGKVYFSVNPDNFANAMINGTFSNIVVKRITRTSRGTPELRSVNSVLTYDGAAVTTGKMHYSLNYYDYTSYANLLAIAKIDAVLSTDQFANNPVTRTFYVAFDMADIYTNFQTAYTSIKGTRLYDGLTMAQDILGSGYQAMTYTSTEGSSTISVRCSAIYIVPQGYFPTLTNVSPSTYHDFRLTSRSALSPFKGDTLGRILPACHYEEVIGFNGATYDVSGIRYYGVRGQMIELPRSMLSQEGTMIVDSSASGFSIKIRIGNSEVDFTNAFSLPCSFSNDIGSEEVQMLNGLKTGVGVLSNIIKNARKGSGLGAGIQFYSDMANAMGHNEVKSNPTEGSAYCTYLPEQEENESIDDYIEKCHSKWASPFINGYIDDIADTSHYIYNYGVITDLYPENVGILSSLPTRAALSGLNETSTFVQAAVEVTGCTAEERDAIVSAFADGIRYVWYESTT